MIAVYCDIVLHFRTKSNVKISRVKKAFNVKFHVLSRCAIVQFQVHSNMTRLNCHLSLNMKKHAENYHPFLYLSHPINQ